MRQLEMKPNAAAQPLPEAEATKERTLEAVGCSGLFGKAMVSRCNRRQHALSTFSPSFSLRHF
jgi:hypothetical protein